MWRQYERKVVAILAATVLAFLAACGAVLNDQERQAARLRVDRDLPYLEKEWGIIEAALMPLSARRPVEAAGKFRFYENIALEPWDASFPSAPRTFLSSEVIKKLNAVKVASLSARVEGEETTYTKPWSPEALAALPLEATYGLLAVLDLKYLGAEVDLGYQGKAMTVTLDLDGKLTLEVASRNAAALVGPTAEQITNQYGIGPVVSESADWTPHELAVLAHALSLLSPDELRVIRGVPFLRVDEPSESPPYTLEDGFTAAMFLFKDGKRWIEVSDRAFPEHEGIVGEVAAPHPSATQVILHEVGHAIEKHEVQLLTRWLFRANAMAEDMNALGRSGVYLERSIDRLNEMFRRVEALNARVGAEGFSTPALRSFMAVDRSLEGPTRYSRVHASEAWAEAFALFHVDPKALERTQPEVHAYFAAGKHLADLALPPTAVNDPTAM